MESTELQRESTKVLGRLLRFNTVNPPGNERPAIDYLAGYLGEAGFHTEILESEPGRANLIATLSAGAPERDGTAGQQGAQDGPTLLYLGHVDTVLADPHEWSHDPWSGEVFEGSLWGRGALDMKSQVAAEAVAGAALAREGWVPRRGCLKLVFVADEETGGDLGARWLCENHPEKVRCDMLLNEGAGIAFEFGGSRRYGVCCGEKGVFRFRITAHGTAGHASLPRTGDNALLKLGPVLQRLSDAPIGSYQVTEAPAGLLRGLGLDPDDPAGAVNAIAREAPALTILLEPMLGVTLTPTMADASAKVNVIPSRASIKVDCRVPPGLGEDAAREAIASTLGEVADGLEISFEETVIGNSSPVRSRLMDAIGSWLAQHDPEAAGTVPVILPGFSDSRWFREAFPECVAYGFFPQRYMSLLEAAPLIHNANERIDVRDLRYATQFFADLARDLLG